MGRDVAPDGFSLSTNVSILCCEGSGKGFTDVDAIENNITERSYSRDIWVCAPEKEIP